MKVALRKQAYLKMANITTTMYSRRKNDACYVCLLTDEESNLARSYCSIHGISFSEALKRALIERIEDELDLVEYKAAKKRYDENPVSYSLEEVRKELDF